MDKKLRPLDLSILTELKGGVLDLKPLVEWVAIHRPSHSQGKQILEIAGELILMGQHLSPLLQRETRGPVFLLKALRELRFPESQAQDKKNAEMIARLPWSHSVKARWIRENDRAGLSVQFNSFSLRDFKQKIQKLESVYQELKQLKVYKTDE